MEIIVVVLVAILLAIFLSSRMHQHDDSLFEPRRNMDSRSDLHPETPGYDYGHDRLDRRNRPIVIYMPDNEPRPQPTPFLGIAMLLIVGLFVLAYFAKYEHTSLTSSNVPKSNSTFVSEKTTTENTAGRETTPASEYQEESYLPRTDNDESTPELAQDISFEEPVLIPLRKSHAVVLGVYSTLDGVYLLKEVYRDTRIEPIQLGAKEFLACILADSYETAGKKANRFLQEHKDAARRGIDPYLLTLDRVCDGRFVREKESETWFCKE